VKGVRGRPSLLSEDLIKKMEILINNGSYPLQAARICNIPSSSFYRWLQRGELEQTGEFREFWERMKRAQAKTENQLTTTIMEAALGQHYEMIPQKDEKGNAVKDENGEPRLVPKLKYGAKDWKASAWLLEHRPSSVEGEGIKAKEQEAIQVVSPESDKSVLIQLLDNHPELHAELRKLREERSR
jgi:hypothetical protein